MKNRRVGTFTLGITLIATGVMYLTYMFAPEVVNLLLVMKFWPIVLILLGGEVLLSCFLNKEEKLRYDGWAIFLIICLVGFAWCMAGAAFVVENGNNFYNGHWYF